jgi:hypothetical protein
VYGGLVVQLKQLISTNLIVPFQKQLKQLKQLILIVGGRQPVKVSEITMRIFVGNVTEIMKCTNMIMVWLDALM